MLLMHTRASKFDQFHANRLKRPEIELLLTVVTALCGRSPTALQPIGANDLSGGLIFHQQMVADSVERVGIQTRCPGTLQAFVELEIEDCKSQCLRGADFIGGFGQTVIDIPSWD